MFLPLLGGGSSVSFCQEALREALQKYGQPEIFNTDQGSQFTSPLFTGILLEKDIAISMGGRGRALDNVFIERLWRSTKYECLYLHRFEESLEVSTALKEYYDLHNNLKPRQALKYKTPANIFWAGHPTMVLEC